MNRKHLSIGHSNKEFMFGSILFLGGIIFIHFGARMVLSPLLLAVEHEFGVNHTVAGSFFLYVSIPYGFMMFLSGFFSEKLRHRGVIILSLIVTGSGTFVLSQSNALWVFKVGLVLIGLGGGLYTPAGLATIPTLATQENWGKAFSVHEIGPVMGFILAPVFAEIGFSFGSWRTAYLIFSIVTWCVFILYLIFGKGGEFKGRPPSFKNVKNVVRIVPFMVVSLFFVLMVGLELGVYAMLPTFLRTEHAMRREFVNLIVGVSRMSGLFVIFLSGFLVDKIGEKSLLTWICGLAGICTLLIGLLQGAVLIIVVFLQPLIVAGFFPAALTAISKLVPPRLRNVSTSLLIPAGYLFGGGIAPAFLGFLADEGYFAIGFISLGAVMVVAMPLIIHLKIIGRLQAVAD